MQREVFVSNKMILNRIGRSIVVMALGVLTCAVCYGQQPDNRSTTGSTQASMVSASAKKPDDRYRIGPGDLISLTTLDYPQLSSDAIRVDSRGMILLPLVQGEIEAACRTEGELAQEVTKRYLKYIREPQVKIFVREFQSQNVAIIGAVNSPGRFQLQRRVRLLELLAFVGGPSSQAGRSIQIFHAGSPVVCEGTIDDSTGPQLVSVNLRATMRGDESANPYVLAGDIITVPDADQYFIVGNVARPSAYPLKDRVSITHAIVLAGGTLPDTTDRIKIVRQTSGARTELIVDLKQVMKTGVGEVFLEPNDVVEVSKKGGLAMGFKNALKTMIPTLTNLPLRVIY